MKDKVSAQFFAGGSSTLSMPYGLFGFEDHTSFILEDSEYSPFMWLHSIQDPSLSFLVVDPFLFFEEYELDVDDESLAKIDVASPADVAVLSIITAPGDGTPITANLQGPVIINKKNGKCMQVVLSDIRWQTKHNIMDEIKKRSATC